VLHPYHETVLALACQKYLCFFHVRGPAHLEPLFDALVHRTVVFVMGKGAVGFRALPFGNFQMVAQLNGRDAERLIIALDAPFDISFQIV
jgi:hypothetical protein